MSLSCIERYGMDIITSTQEVKWASSGSLKTQKKTLYTVVETNMDVGYAF